VVQLIGLSNHCQNDSLHLCAKINTRIQLPGFTTLCTGLSGCVFSLRVQSLSPKQHFKVYFMALDKNLMHATMLNSFAQNVLNSSQNKFKSGAPVGYCTSTWKFCFIWCLLLFWSTAHSTLHSL